MFRVLKPYQLVADCALAVIFFLIIGGIQRPNGYAESALLIGMTLTLLLRRISPPVALGIAWISALAQMYVAGLGPLPVDFAILAVVYSTSRYGGRLLKWLGLVSVGLGAVLASAYLTLSGRGYQFGFYFDLSSAAEIAKAILQFAFILIAMLVLLGLPWTFGLLVRTRIVARESREAQLAAQQEAARAEQGVIVEQERNRIARDMHDVVAHSLAVVIAQADGARYARATDPTAVDSALSTISSTAREALGDVRLLLGQLRHAQSEGPQPALSDLGRLLDQLRASGLTIGFESVGAEFPLGTAGQLAVYRIVQEALTNALRHGDVSQETTVHFAWTPTDLEVTISSALTASPATGELRLGHGLAGMKERAALVGGGLSTEVDDRRFVVRAVIPAIAAAATA